LGEGIHQAWSREGYTVDWLQDAAALHALLSETFDVAVLDLGLPRMDGLECCDACATAARTCRC
jgi:two-component system response regulator QseB